MKKSAVKSGVSMKPGQKDEGIGKWLYVTYPDDLFKHGIDIDFEKLKYKPLSYNTTFEEIILDESSSSSDDGC